MTRRVLHVSQPVEAGVARVTLDLMADQAAAGWSVRLACPAGSLARQASAAGTTWHPWRATRQPGPGVAGEAAALGRLVRADGPDLVHLHSSAAGLAGRLSLRGRVPTVFQPHAWSFAAATGVQQRAALAWERLAARWTTLQICCSPEEQAQGRASGVGGRSVVVPNGVDLSRLPAVDQRGRARARARLALPAHVPLALCAGRLSRQKGQDVALRAWPSVRAAVPGALLLLAGDGPERDALAAAAASRDGVRLLGPRDDVPDLLAACDVVVLPSRWEGLALALLEAMATARCVVATAAAGSASSLLGGDLPVAGAVVPVDDVEALGAAVARRLADPVLAREEGLAGRRRAEASHDLAHACEVVRDHYEMLLPPG